MPLRIALVMSFSRRDILTMMRSVVSILLTLVHRRHATTIWIFGTILRRDLRWRWATIIPFP
jgi:hypothetical protein